MKNTGVNIVCVVVALLLGYYLAAPLQNFYCANIGTCTGGFFGFDLGVLIWMVLTYGFFVTAFLTALGGRRKYWWIGISLIPAILFEVVLDPLHIYFPIILGVIAWGLGTMAHRVLTKLAPSFMAKVHKS